MIVLSQFKFTILWMVINFFDILIIDSDTISFLLTIFPDLRITLLVAGAAGDPGAWSLLWRLDPFRVPRLACAGSARVRAASRHRPACRSRCRRSPRNSSRASITSRRSSRSGVTSAIELVDQGLDRLRHRRDRTACARRRTSPAACPASRRTSSWCSTRRASTSARCPASRCRRTIGDHFQSFDGKTRSLAGRGRGRADLVHRIQRADRPFGALLRPAAATTSRASPPAGSSAACRRRCGAAATRPSRSIRPMARSSARASSSRRRASSACSIRTR